MKQHISTACDSNLGAPLAEVTVGADTVYASGPAQGAARQPWIAHPAAQLDAPIDEITAKARAAMSVARELNAGQWSISLFDEDGYSTFLDPGPAMLAVLRVAVQVEPDPVEAGFWYRHSRIAELGGLTAAQLVVLGRAEEVIRFLLSVRDGRRD